MREERAVVPVARPEEERVVEERVVKEGVVVIPAADPHRNREARPDVGIEEGVVERIVRVPVEPVVAVRGAAVVPVVSVVPVVAAIVPAVVVAAVIVGVAPVAGPVVDRGKLRVAARHSSCEHGESQQRAEAPQPAVCKVR
jgi:hypothetical protein